MTTITSPWTVPVPARMWFVDTRMGGYTADDRSTFGNSPFANWQRVGRMFLCPWAGKPTEFDTRLDQMQPGDPVFAYEHGAGVVAIGRVCAPKDLVEGPTPLYPRFGDLVKSLAVDWNISVTRTKSQVHAVTNLGGSNLKSCGPGKAFFPMAMDMLQEAHDRHRANPDADEVAAFKRIASSPAYTPKMKAQLGQARIGQGQFRKAVLTREPACRVTGITQPPYLVASHIKPWAVCVGDEHLDGANGLMLAPHVDHLFDTGRISFTDSGDLLLAPTLDPAILKAWDIDEKLNVGPFSTDQTRYLAYHRQFVLGQPRPRRQRNLVGDVPSGAADVYSLQLATDAIAGGD